MYEHFALLFALEGLQDGPPPAFEHLAERIARIDESSHRLADLLDVRVKDPARREQLREMILLADALHRERLRDLLARAPLPARPFRTADARRQSREDVARLIQPELYRLRPIGPALLGRVAEWLNARLHAIPNHVSDHAAAERWETFVSQSDARLHCAFFKSNGADCPMNPAWDEPFYFPKQRLLNDASQLEASLRSYCQIDVRLPEAERLLAALVDPRGNDEAETDARRRVSRTEDSLTTSLVRFVPAAIWLDAMSHRAS